MATTTNYGWTTPDDTALVKDGASAIRSLGTSIDTTTKNLNPSTTLGDIEYRSSSANTNTRLAIGTSGQALTVVAGVPSWAASATSVLTTTGDLLYASAANTLARRGIGTTGQVLTVSGGVPTWASPAGGGKVLQVVQGQTNTTVNNSSASMATTGLSASITPSSTSSKVLMFVTMNGMAKRTGNTAAGVNIAIKRNGSFLNNPATSQNWAQGNFRTDSSLYNRGSASVNYLDSPASTSSQSYEIFFEDITGTCEAQAGNSASVIILMEIGA
jgi:hypothetical protein